jgi:uncharacterized membrane protein YkvA (DUF1232 family)
MTDGQWFLYGLAIVAALYAGTVLLLIALGRRTQARALAGFIPDCLVLLRRLVGDPRVPRRRKLVLVALAAYLAMPIDVVPDFIPVAGQLDDLIIAALALRYALRVGSVDWLTEHWPGPANSLELVLPIAHGDRA